MAYSETIKGQFSPLVAVRQYDGSTSYRDLTREDLLRVADDQASPGGWLFKKTQNAASSWIKRYALLRGDYLFFFHSPQNDKPIGVVVVAGSKVVTPDNGGSSFEELTRSYRANEGYEFDITHPSRPTVRLQALSEQERHQWVVAVAARAEKSKASGSTSSRTEYIGNTNIIVTGTRLTGISLTTTKMVGSSADADDYRSYSNAYSPSRSASPSRAAGGVASTNTYGGDNKATSAVPFSGGASTSVGIPRSYSAEQAATIQPSDIAVRAPMQLDVPLQATPPTAGRGRRASVIQTKIMEHSKDMLALEKNLQRKMNEQLEARNREIAVRDR